MKNILLLLILLPALVSGQDSTITKTYLNTTTPVTFSSMIKANDTGFVATGGYDNGTLVMKVADTGDIFWKKAFPSLMMGRKVISTNDNGYVVAGNYASAGQNNQFCMKLNANGDTVWTRGLINSLGGLMGDVAVTSSNDIVMASEEGDIINITRIDPTGNIIWSENVEFTGWPSRVNSVKVTTDGKIMVCGNNNSRFFLMSLNGNGTINWLKMAPAGSSTDMTDFLLSGNKIYMMIREGINYQQYLVRSDLEGNPEQSFKLNVYSGWYFPYDAPAPGLHLDSHGDIFFVSGGQEGLFVRMDTTGNVVFVDAAFIQAVDVLETGNNYLIYGNGPVQGADGYIWPQAGLISTDSAGNSRGCMYPTMITVEASVLNFQDTLTVPVPVTPQFVPLHPAITDPLINVRPGCVDFVGGVDEKGSSDVITVSPNPAVNRINVSIRNYNGDTLNFRIYDATGKMVRSTVVRSASTAIDLSGLSSGLYLWKAGNMAGKVLISNN